MMELILDILRDGFFAGIAAIGFASISKPENRVYLSCAIIAALGHMTRYILMGQFHIHITFAAMVAGVVIGLAALVCSYIIHTPSESLAFPALLPMIPGMYAYRTIQAVVHCLTNSDEQQFIHYMYLLESNWITCVLTIVSMVVGATIPIFVFHKFSFKVVTKLAK